MKTLFIMLLTVVGNSSKVVLVDVAAFAPGTGEALGELLGTFPVDPSPGIPSPVDGFDWYDFGKYQSGFSLSIYF